MVQLRYRKYWRTGYYSQDSYSQIVNQPTHMTKESSSCIDLIFMIPNLISTVGVDCYFSRNAIIASYMTLLILRSYFHHLTWEKFGIIKMLIQAIYKVLFLTQTWSSYFERPMLTKKLILNQCSKNIFHDLFPTEY